MSEPLATINFAGNDYLGLASNPRLVEAAHLASTRLGISATSSRWGLGWTEVHEQLEAELAAFLGSEAACLLNQAFVGGLVYFTEMSADYDTVFCDEQSHTNLLLGMKASGLNIHTYRHLNIGDLRTQLDCHPARRCIIATDTVFGISGELAPLTALRDVARAHHAELLLDDAHGVFALGANGRGAVEMCGLSPEDATVLGSMSKALGSGGGFLSGRCDLVERFRRNRVTCSSTPLAIPLAAASLEAQRIVGEKPVLLTQLHENAQKMREILSDQGFYIVSDQTPIIALQLADAGMAKRMSQHFLEHGIRVPYFKYPTEPRKNLLRTVARSCYKQDDFLRFANAVASFEGSSDVTA